MQIAARIVTLLFIIIYFHSTAFSQTTSTDERSKPTKQDTLTDEVFRKLLNEQFATILTGKAQNGIGNFGALDLKEAEVSFAGTSVIKKGQLLSIKASGGVSDGLFAIFDNSKLNSNLSIDIQYNIWDKKPKKLGYWTDSKYRYEQEKQKLENAYKLRELQITKNYDRLLLETLTAKTVKEIDSLENLQKKETDKTKLGMLAYKIAKSKQLKDSASLAIKAIPSDPTLLLNAGNQRDEKIKKLDSLIQVQSFLISWWSFGIKAKNSKFYLFNPSLLYENQVNKNNYTTTELKVQRSLYRYINTPWESYYVSGGLGVSITDNLASLDKVELSETTNYDVVLDKRASTKKYNAYLGEYKRDILNFRAFFEGYYFLFKDNIAAVHFYPEINFAKNEKPITNLGLGFLYSFKDEKSAKFNVELYYNALDLFHHSDAEQNLLNRNSIGLRFAFPITFK